MNICCEWSYWHFRESMFCLSLKYHLPYLFKDTDRQKDISFPPHFIVQWLKSQEKKVVTTFTVPFPYNMVDVF